MNGKILDEVVLALVDLSGSMAGQSFSKVKVQISELFSELRTARAAAVNSIRFGLLGFHESQQWISPPEEVDQIDSLPMLAIGTRQDGLGARSNYSIMFHELDRCMNRHFLCRGRDLNSVHIILFTDGYPTDDQAVLKNSLEALKKNPVFSNERCRRYVIREKKTAVGQYDRYLAEFWYGFVPFVENVVDADRFSEMLGRIRGELTGGVEEENVFG